MLIHIYLANIEGISPTLLMFFRKEHGGLVYSPEKHNDRGRGRPQASLGSLAVRPT